MSAHTPEQETGAIEVVDIDGWSGPWPVPDNLDAHYWAAAAAGILLVQECRACSARQHVPRGLCVACGATPHWIAVRGHGTIYSYTIVRQMGAAPFKERVPYVVALIDLEEGPRLMGNVVDCEPERVRIGAAVRAVMHRYKPDVAAPQWRLS